MSLIRPRMWRARNRRAGRIVVGGVFLLAVGCGADSGRGAPSVPGTAGPVTTSSTPMPAAVPPAPPGAATPPPAPIAAEEARRFLERQGIDPDDLSADVAEQMRRRLKPASE